jgi:integrase
VAKTHRHGPLFELALRTGLRQGELGLKWDDLDLDAGHLTVRRTLARTPGEATFTDVKTHRSARRISIPQECVTSLRWYHRRQQQNRRDPATPGATSASCSPDRPVGRSTPPTCTATTTPSATSPESVRSDSTT